MHARAEDFVFASVKSSGEVPRCGAMIVRDYLKPAAVKAGVISEDEERFGFHNLQHSFSTLLAKDGHDPKLIQLVMGHADLKMTGHYIHHSAEQQLAAQSKIFEQLKPVTAAVQ